MKKVYKIIIVVGLLLLVGLAGYLFYNGNGNTAKAAFVKNNDLYNEFSLKKELEAKLIKVKDQRKTILDSLMLELKMTSTELENTKDRNEKEIQKFQFKKQLYISKQKEFDEDTQRLAEQYSQQIWKQINQYVEDYGKQKGYAFIHGANGDGALMYAGEHYDITKELTGYINERYNGEKK